MQDHLRKHLQLEEMIQPHIQIEKVDTLFICLI
jgi:hypothetical protein